MTVEKRIITLQLILPSFLAVLMLTACSLLSSSNKTNNLSNSLFKHIVIDTQGPSGIWLKSIGDLNGDNRIDLIAGGNSSGGLVWYENPNWEKRIISSVGSFSTDAEVSDIDRDGDNDIFVLTASDVRWYENPSWQMQVIDSMVLHDLEVADFDGDQDIDFVGRNQGEFGMQGNELHFYQQESPQTWVHRVVEIPDGEGLAVVDIDEDRDLDVVTNGSWFENTGGILKSPWNEHPFTKTWSHPNSYISTGDINKDGRVDIILAPSELENQTYRLSWFESPVDPQQDVWNEHVIQDDIEAVQHFSGVVDIDRDGDEDVVVAEMQQGNDPDEIIVFFNDDGIGTSWSREVMAETGSHSMRIGDFDSDGDMDLYGANWQSQQVDLFENSTCPDNLANWERQVIDTEKPGRSIFIASEDLNGDGKKDIVTGGWWYPNPGDLKGNWVRNTIGAPLHNVAVTYDFDEDGDYDILGTAGQGSEANPNFVLGLNDGSGNFSIIENVALGDGDFLQGIAVGRFKAGENIMVALSWHGGSTGIQLLTIPSYSITDPWKWEKITTVSQNEALSMGDIDRDKDQDLLLGTVWLENRDGSWFEHEIHDSSGSPDGERNPDRNKLIDINQDGRLDAVIGYEAISIKGKVAWYQQGVTATSKWIENVIGEVIGPMSIDVADIDNDNDYDVIVGEHNLEEPSTARLFVFENDGEQKPLWKTHVVYTGDEHHDGAQFVDIDNDGDQDIVSIGWDNPQVLLYIKRNPNCENSSRDCTRKSYLPITSR